MFAIVKIGGKQFKVILNQNLDIDSRDEEVGSTFELSDVLMISDNGEVEIQPTKAKVKCVIVKHFRGPKLIVFKNRPRSTFRKKTGHKQDYTRIQIQEIVSN